LNSDRTLHPVFIKFCFITNSRTHTDQLGRSIKLASSPKRIISLVPSQTELLFDLGLDAEVVGITKFCVHPNHWFKSKTRVGGTKNYDFDKIKLLNPDLIIGNKEENEQNQMQELMKIYSVWMSDVRSLTQAFEMINSVGQLVNKTEKANDLIRKIALEFISLKKLPLKKCAYLIWKKPFLCAGSDTFIDALLQENNLVNCFQNMGRYPEVTAIDLQAAQADVIFLSSEPYPFKEKDIPELQEICPNAKILCVDGELFSWYGSRLLRSPSYFSNLLKAL
jgi:ABC-type Fe3+-hydroxamate transport system substrate-binding protein